MPRLQAGMKAVATISRAVRQSRVLRFVLLIRCNEKIAPFRNLRCDTFADSDTARQRMSRAAGTNSASVLACNLMYSER